MTSLQLINTVACSELIMLNSSSCFCSHNFTVLNYARLALYMHLFIHNDKFMDKDKISVYLSMCFLLSKLHVLTIVYQIPLSRKKLMYFYFTYMQLF